MSDTGDGLPNRRELLRQVGLAATAVGLAGCTGDGEDGGGGGGGDGNDGPTPMDGSDGGGGGDGGAGGDGDDGGEGGDGADGSCSPGHTEGDPACEQIAADAEVLTTFDAAGTALPVAFDHPCGWMTGTTDQFEDRAQANATRSEIGEVDGYVDIQVRAYFEPVSEGFLDAEKEEGQYDEIEYEYGGDPRRGLVSGESTAQYGTLGHAVVPYEDALVHVELVSTLQAEDCGVEPRPDYGLVGEMLRSISPNSDTTFAV